MDIIIIIFAEKSTSNKRKPSVNQIKTTKKKSTKKAEPLSSIEMYKAFRAAHDKHVPNVKSMKRRFFKHDPDKIEKSNNANKKPKGSVFSDKDFENFMSK